MKRNRLLACILALLLAVSLLPMGVMADDLPDNDVNQALINQPFGTNRGTGVGIDPNGSVQTNVGSVRENRGTVETNNGTVAGNFHIVADNNGTVMENKAGGMVANNKAGGTVQNNEEHGTVGSNEAGATVERNNRDGTVQNNSGLVGTKDGNGNVIAASFSGNAGTVNVNESGGVVANIYGGTVGTNKSNGDGTNPGVVNKGGTVTTNTDGGTVVNNGGSVDINSSNGHGTNPGVINKRGTVYNNDGGTVVNYSGGVVRKNLSGVVINNGGEVNRNNSTVDNHSGSVNNNRGTVRINGIGGTVTNTRVDTAGTNYGTVETNYGTVYQDQDTYYGLQGVDEVGTQHYLGSHKSGTELNLDAQAATIQREGYKLNGYTVWTYDKDNAADDKLAQQPVPDTTKYTIDAPTVLKLVWEQIVSVVKPDSGGEGEGSSYNPNYIGLGSVIFINEKGYKVVQLKDEAYVAVSFDALPEEEVADLDALFAKLFTPEQQKLIQNMGQLLDAEDVLTVFGKPGNHPVFEISKELAKR